MWCISDFITEIQQTKFYKTLNSVSRSIFPLGAQFSKYTPRRSLTKSLTFSSVKWQMSEIQYLESGKGPRLPPYQCNFMGSELISVSTSVYSDSMYFSMFVCVCAGPRHRQKCAELSLGQACLRDPDAELGSCHGGPHPPERDYR